MGMPPPANPSLAAAADVIIVQQQVPKTPWV
jgi:hypothetical protein